MLRHAVFAFSRHHVLYVQPTMTKRIQKGVGGSDFIGLVARAYDCRIAQPPAENPAVFFCEWQCERLVWEVSEGLSTQHGRNRRFLAKTDLSSHASAPHKLMIQHHHLEHALTAFGMHFALQNSCDISDHKIRANRFVTCEWLGQPPRSRGDYAA
jgi:hypothetical protein